MRTSRTTTSLCTLVMSFDSPLFRLCFLYQEGKAIVPKAFEELSQTRQPFRTETVEPARPLLADGDQARGRQNAEMLRDRGTRDLEMRRDLPYRHLLKP